MRVLMISAEHAPLAKTGGLADAVAGLSATLAARGHDVRVLTPDYGNALPSGVRVAATRRLGTLGVTDLHDSGVPVYRVASPAIAAEGRIYTGDDRDAARFWAFSRAAIEVAASLDWRPDVIHCHDWHTALVPALARIGVASGAGSNAIAETPTARTAGTASRATAGQASLAGIATVLTLHNAGFQGAFARALLPEDAAAFFAAVEDDAARRSDHAVFLKIGIRTADAVTTVSPTYARELSTPELGMGLDGLLRARGNDFVGILNGVDPKVWSPESDPFIEPRFERGDDRGKARVKRALAAELGFVDVPEDAPIVGVVSRLFEQKGIDLLVAGLPALLERTRARFAVLGSGDTDLETELTAAAKAHPERIAFRCGYDEALAHRIIAGSDVLVVPSRYEPCGLTQMYALRYGTVPVVRKTGGLADTVKHYDPATGEGTGSVFEDADVGGLLWGLTTALGWYASAPDWERIRRNGGQVDFSWTKQAEPYERLYRTIA